MRRADAASMKSDASVKLCESTQECFGRRELMMGVVWVLGRSMKGYIRSFRPLRPVPKWTTTRAVAGRDFRCCLEYRQVMWCVCGGRACFGPRHTLGYMVFGACFVSGLIFVCDEESVDPVCGEPTQQA